MSLRFDIYGRFEIEIEPTANGWVGYRRGSGVRRLAEELVFPQGIKEDELEIFLDDIYHESALPGSAIKRIS